MVYIKKNNKYQKTRVNVVKYAAARWIILNHISFVLPTGFRTFHFVSFLYVFFFFSFLFLLFCFFSHFFVFVFFFAFRLFFFFFVSFRYFSHFRYFLFVFSAFCSVSQFTGTLEMQLHTTSWYHKLAQNDRSCILFGKMFQYKEFAILPTPLNLPMCIFTPCQNSAFSWPNLTYLIYILFKMRNFTKCVATEGSNLSPFVKVDKPIWKYYISLFSLYINSPYLTWIFYTFLRRQFENTESSTKKWN